ncbi:MAG: bifunctional hydroxymethylpyrimidine kinase/phosphomethylpyrimidine kinase [Clostridiales bacterium]|jgi:hydroxymethylpyrimidine/phosphomethylpyrimidine kinase|nr:bifunctional hydroxymethylpyrimidine kinase/phosphomethylpyrimidine kinase [Clostridiales bacterium]
MKKVLTIAGSDCSGGAGIQADIKTITAHKMYAMSAITALTAQNTTGVYGVLEATPEFIGSQLDCIFKDIRPDAVKIGMVSNTKIIEIIADKLGEYKAQNIVVDPVMVSTSGGKLLNDNAIDALINYLFSLATVITPNIPEAETLVGFSINDRSDMQKAAEKLSKLTTGSVLIKGGHLEDSADDLLFTDGKVFWLKSPKIYNPNTHGTGCTLSSAIACNLALGLTTLESVKNAKEYITGAIKAGLNIGRGRGPLNHCYNL